MRDLHYAKFFRLTARLPLEVKFPSRQFLLRCDFIQYANHFELDAYPDGSTAAHWSIKTLGARQEDAERVMYEEGFEVPAATVAETILQRLVREGRAQRLAQIGGGHPSKATLSDQVIDKHRQCHSIGKPEAGDDENKNSRI